MSTDRMQPGEQIYVCPMHRDIRHPGPGKCPKCGMALVAEGARFGLVQHMLNPLHLSIMVAVMVVVMIAAMKYM